MITIRAKGVFTHSRARRLFNHRLHTNRTFIPLGQDIPYLDPNFKHRYVEIVDQFVICPLPFIQSVVTCVYILIAFCNIYTLHSQRAKCILQKRLIILTFAKISGILRFGLDCFHELTKSDVISFRFVASFGIVLCRIADAAPGLVCFRNRCHNESQGYFVHSVPFPKNKSIFFILLRTLFVTLFPDTYTNGCYNRTVHPLFWSIFAILCYNDYMIKTSR